MISSTHRPTLAIAALTLALSAWPASAAAQAPSGQKPLYERLGGVYPIAVVVDEFIDRLLVNEVLNRNPAITAARQQVPAPGLKYHVTALMCKVTGGPCGYSGRTMKQAHAHLDIREREWQEMVRVFRAVLNDMKVPATEQQELVAIVESTKGDIVAASR